MFDSNLAAVAFGLLSAMTWGAGDFCGGMASKRGRVTAVVVVSQLAGVTVLIGLALFLAEPTPPAADWLRGAAAGISGAVGLLSLYRGLANGRMSVVASIAAIRITSYNVCYTKLLQQVHEPGIGLNAKRGYDSTEAIPIWRSFFFYIKHRRKIV